MLAATSKGTHMRTSFISLTGVALLWAAGAMGASTEKLKVLLVTGDDVKAHDWREMAEATKDVLAAGKFEVDMREGLSVFDSADNLKGFDLIFLSYFNAKATLSDQARANLLNFVKGGKGLALSHLSSACFADWDEFRKMVGRYWVFKKSGHGPRSVFTARIADRDHPITKGAQDFQVDDELYAKLEGDAPIHVLVTADSDWSKRTEPLAFTLAYGQGRVFHEAFGHDGKAIKTPGVAELIRRGCEWAATGKVD